MTNGGFYMLLFICFTFYEYQNATSNTTAVSLTTMPVPTKETLPAMTCEMRRDFLYMSIKFVTEVSKNGIMMWSKRLHYAAPPDPAQNFTDCTLRNDNRYLYEMTCKAMDPKDYKEYRVGLFLGNESIDVVQSFRPIVNFKGCSVGDDVMDWNITLVTSKQVEIYGNISESAAILMYRISIMAFLPNGSKVKENRCEVEDEIANTHFRCNVHALQLCQKYKLCMELHMTYFMRSSRCFNIATKGCVAVSGHKRFDLLIGMGVALIILLVVLLLATVARKKQCRKNIASIFSKKRNVNR